MKNKRTYGMKKKLKNTMNRNEIIDKITLILSTKNKEYMNQAMSAINSDSGLLALAGELGLVH